MRALVLLAVGVALVVTLAIRHTEGQDEPSAESPVLHEQRDGGVQVFTAEDMERLRQARRALMERESPLGEEADPVGALRHQHGE